MSDMASHSAPQHDNGELRHTMSVHDVGAALVEAGVPRSHRQIIRYCETGMLEAVKVPGPTGAQWYVSPASIPKAIGDLKQWEAQRARQSPTETDVANHVEPKKPLNDNSAVASQSAPEPAVSDPVITARYVEQLEKRLDEKDDVIGLLKGQLIAKDEQIGELSTRYRETHMLLGAMQRMLAPLLGQGDPHNTPKKGAGADAEGIA